MSIISLAVRLTLTENVAELPEVLRGMSILGEFWEWWTGELASFLPRQDMRKLLRGKVRREIQLSRQGARLLEWKSVAAPGKVIATATDLSALLGEIKRPTRLVVSLDDDLVLRRKVKLPPNTRREAEMLALDAERSTPFKRGEFLFVWRGSDARDIEQAIIRRDYFNTLREAIAAAGHRLAGVSVRLGEQDFWPNALTSNATRLGEKQANFWSKAALASVFLAFATWFGALSYLNSRMQSSLLDIENQITTIQPAAKTKRDEISAIEKNIGELASLHTERSASVHLTSVWAAITEVMPDDSSLQTLNLKGRELTLTGISAKPEALLGGIEANPQFSNVRFISPLVATQGTDSVQFAITANIEASP
jgi:general secretion pathway protein L